MSDRGSKELVQAPELTDVETFVAPWPGVLLEMKEQQSHEQNY